MMATAGKKPTGIIVSSIIIVGVVVWLAFAAAGENKSYYVTITELQAMGNKAYTRHLRVAGNVQPGSIQRVGTNAHFALLEQGQVLQVQYQGIEPPPDTFKDDAQALAIGTYGRDGSFPRDAAAGEVREQVCAPKPGARPGQPAAHRRRLLPRWSFQQR